MTAYSFKKQFIAAIESGQKCQTMRNDRKSHAKVGGTLQLYYGMRTKQCRLIGTAICAQIMPVRIDFSIPTIDLEQVESGQWSPGQLNQFARGDGFETWGDLVAFWRKEHAAITAWSGVLIKWRDFQIGQNKSPA